MRSISWDSILLLVRMQSIVMTILLFTTRRLTVTCIVENNRSIHAVSHEDCVHNNYIRQELQEDQEDYGSP